MLTTKIQSFKSDLVADDRVGAVACDALALFIPQLNCAVLINCIHYHGRVMDQVRQALLARPDQLAAHLKNLLVMQGDRRSWQAS